jgi:uncharacterized protein (TIGR03000 family)
MEVYSMYSIVLMAALSGSGDLPAFGHRGGCCGCNGGYSCGCCGNYGCGCEGGGHRRGHRHRGGCGCCGQTSCGCCGNTNSCGCCGASACCSSGCEPAEATEGEHHERKGPSKKEPEKIGKPKEGKKATRGPAPATIIVSLPANAKLTVDDTVTKSTSATRVFTSPALENGQEYLYNLKAEVVQNGKTITLAKQVAVRAGNETSVSLFPETSLASR